MATYTPNYNLGKPEASDPFANFRQLFNDNMDEIDANMGGGGGSGGHTIVDPDGNSLPQEDDLQFTGAVSVMDDNVNGRTVVNVSGGSNLILDAQIYSTEEKQVGVWTDKKPLYAKTYTATITSGTQWIDTGLDSGDLIVKSEGTLEQNNGQILTLASGDTGAGAGINTFIVGVVTPSKWSCLFRTTSNDARGNLTLTLYYTKGSDVAGSGGYEAYGFSPVIYSDVERVIGVWRDNKPLYQKTIVLNSEITVSNNDWTSTGVTASSLDVETYARCTAQNSGGTCWDAVNAATINGYVSLTAWRNGDTIGVKTFTIQYTKTTDVAGSGDYNTYGVPTVHYSTSEQVIGTWTNGKPLYEITVEVNSVNHNDWTDVFSLADADIKGYDSRTSYAQLNNGERVQLDWFVTTSIYNRSIITNSGTKFRVETQGNNYSKIVATIQYTKTTD